MITDVLLLLSVPAAGLILGFWALWYAQRTD